MFNFIRKIAFLLTMVVLILLLKSFPKKSVVIRRKFAKADMFCLGCEVDLQGEFDKKAQLLILNHQSMLDIIAMEAIYPGNLAWIAKVEIARMPFFGELTKATQMISIDRNNPRDIVRVIKEAKQKLDSGRILAIFPEGTRGPGKQLLEFKSGVKLIAKKLNIKVQPILIKNSSEILGKNLLVRPAKLIIKPLPIIDTNDDKWLQNAQALMQKEQDALYKNG